MLLVDMRLLGMRLCLQAMFGALLAAAAPCAQAQSPPPCHGTFQPREVAELMFGRDIGSRLGVSERDWMRFLSREITPRFPDGLTVTDAFGQWRDRDTGKIVREPSERVEIVLPGKADDQAQLDAVAAAYKQQFHQQEVRVIVRSACVGP
jgi:hypothetical protein